jgi:hypothetical protein
VAELPPHFTPHSLRHTYASLLIQQGESPVYVQRQLGHSSIQLTVDLYGRWLPMSSTTAVERMLGRVGRALTSNGSKMVAVARPLASERPQDVDVIGVDDGTRTRDLQGHNLAL